MPDQIPMTIIESMIQPDDKKAIGFMPSAFIKFARIP